MSKEVQLLAPSLALITVFVTVALGWLAVQEGVPRHPGPVGRAGPPHAWVLVSALPFS